MARHNDIGEWGEEIAREHLIAKGYVVRDTNVRLGRKELDIVAEHEGKIVFVEVKTRSESNGDDLEAMDAAKIRHLCRAAESYVTAYAIPYPVQFDVVLVIGSPDTAHTVTHFPDAFLPPLSVR